MRKTLLLLAMAAVPMLAADPPTCDLTSLNGAFGYKLTGYVYDSMGYTYYLGVVGRMVSDGNGNLTGTDTYSFDGSLVKRQYTGTYTINADCTGSLTITTSNGNSTHADLVIVGNGTEVELVQTDGGYILTGTLKQQNPPVANPQPQTPAPAQP